MSIKNPHYFEIFKQFIVIFLIALMLLCLVAFMHYWQTTQKARTKLETNEITTVNRGKTSIEQQLAGAVSDIKYLASYGEHYRTTKEKAYSLYDDTREQNQALEILLKVFSQEKNIYDQIRFLDVKGAEIIRVNNENGVAIPVAKQKLQQKSARYYVKEINALAKGDLYLSPLDLNIEEGEIELPYKPVLRFGMPVYNANNQRKGSLLLNLKGHQLLSAFKDATITSEAQVMLLNKEGFWLSSPNKEQEWGFMFGRQANFRTEQTDIWNRIQNEVNGQFYNEQNLVTHTSVSPLPADLQGPTTPQWKIVSLVPLSHPALWGAASSYIFLYGPIAILLAIGSWLIAATMARHRQSELQVEFEQRFRQVLEHVDLLAIGLDNHNAITFCNDAFTSLTGWSKDELLGKNWFDQCVDEANKAAAKQTMHDLNTEKIDSFQKDAPIKIRSGEIRQIEWNHTLMKDADGKVIGCTCIGENVTDIRAQEKQVRILSQAVEQSPVVAMIVNTQGGIEYVNPQFTEVTGYTLAEVKGKNPNILKSAEDGDDEKYLQLWETIKAGKTWHGVFKNKRKNGEIYWASASITGIRDSQGEIVNYVGVQEDITERLGLEKKFRMSVEGSPYAMVMVDEHGQIILANSRAEEYFGYPRSELLGNGIEMLIPEEYRLSHMKQRENFTADYLDGISRAHGIGRNLSAKRRDGSEFPVEIALNLIHTDEGKITLASIIDITKRRELEAELEQRNLEVAKSNTLAIIGRMASMVAHDLRNPLSSVKMGLQILSKPPTDASTINANEQNAELKKIALEQVSYMETILEDLLNYARPPALNPEWLDLRKVLDESINLIQGLVSQNKARIDTHIQTGLPTLYADSGKLKQIFSNLISNAIQAAKESGKQAQISIEVMSRLGEDIPGIQIEIIDNGPGVDDENVEQLFEPFFTTRSQGSGLGLAIVKRFIEQHRGKIHIASNHNNKGAICTIVLPVSAVIKQQPSE